MKKFHLILAALVLSACTLPPPDTVPDLTFDNVGSIGLNVAAIEIRDDYHPTMQSPHVDHLFKTPPIAAAHRLLERQLVAAGADKTLRVIIDDASVINEELPVTDGVMGAIKREPSNIYRAKIALRFELVDPAAPDLVLGHAEVVAKRNHTILNGASPAERDRVAFDLTRELMDDVSDGLNTVVKSTFGMR